MAKVSVPSQHPTKVVDFPRLDGGLNLWELDYRLASNQSSEMRNLWWQDGVLQCRDGQRYLIPDSLGTGHTCAQELFWDNAFFHIGGALYRMDMKAETPALIELVTGVAENRGTFFRYNEYLFYKNRGGFYRVTYTPDAESPFKVTNVADDAYAPIIILNGNPATGSGSLYQPENRIGSRKTVHYNAAETTRVVTKTGDGTTKAFTLGLTADADQLTGVENVYFGATLVSELTYTVDLTTGTVTFTTAPTNAVVISFVVKIGVYSYKLPVGEIDAVTEVKVNGVAKVEGDDFAVDLEEGRVLFVKAPPVSDPPVNNTVEITYSKANPDAMDSIMDCPYATVYGGSGNVCIVLGGCEAQPNAFFWNGNDSFALNDTYWPMSFYNLAGDAEDGVTGFGKQYGTLIVLKERSIGRATYGVENVDDRNSISLTYTEINDRIGCDLPWTIQLVENNIVFCNTSGGVHMVRDSSSAMENNIECISRNVNGTPQRLGLLHDVRISGKELTCAFDDDNRYWLCTNGHVYLWDYLLSTWKDPSWFYFTNVHGVAYFRNVDTSYHLDQQGRVTVFGRTFADYEDADGNALPIDKMYQFPPQFFDTYDRLKDVLYCIFTVRSDTDTTVQIQYQSDYETRNDKTDIRSMTWKLFPRNLAYRILSVQRYAVVARRKPGCRHVRHFAMRLSNNAPGEDLAIISAQIYFRYLGRDR